ncbi:lysosomal cobalamin transport escort protein LMBD1 isoform X2 [Morone saxatilis]|uniref:lysosomal cobalamin transport escort protein LMBD1 isoform X2 n=1 Tax=Morone saxatilis TaxID=34816 RepID=UPI0015E24343|nr:lysosomal cobalamin transport escort protein LMBD1 isoform X2 [Morone saxatilis]
MAAQSFLSESLLGWSIFTFILLVILAFCWVYIRKFQSRQESEVVSTITAICALAIALITSALLPVDIFLVSFMKYPNGTYKEWAANNETRGQIEDTVLYGYYNGLPALSFSISSLTLIGMLAVITYTAYGMSVLPLNLIKGTRSVVYERLENTEDIDDVEHQIEKLKSKCNDGRPLSSRDRHNLQELEGKLQVLRRKGRHLEIAERNCCTKVGSALRPLKILLGIFFILVALLFTVALFISNLDKALHSAGISSGFIIFGTNLTNPLNELLLALQPVFPLDYILITVITMYFVVTSMAGIRNMGIWFFWIRLYKIRPKKTRPQALLFLCMILLLIVLHTSYMIYSLAPQYVMYGSQKYLVQSQMPSAGPTSGNATLGTTRICDAEAPEDQCTVTRSYLFLHKFWFFSTIYYFGNWAFIGAFLIGLVVSCCRGKKSVIEGEVEADDSDLSDDEYVH